MSGEISVDGVVSKLLKLALRMAGAESCLLVLDKDGVLCAEAVARSDSIDVEHLRRTDPIDLFPDRCECSSAGTSTQELTHGTATQIRVA